MIELVLPYPISANRYWRSRVLPKKNVAVTYPSKEAVAYKKEIASRARLAGVRKPITGRVAIDINLYPQRPQDWVKRARLNPMSWDDDVRCLDLDNAIKVLLDALRGVVIEDDKWVRCLSATRMEPDGEGRVVLRVVEIKLPQPMQLDIAVIHPSKITDPLGADVVFEKPF